MQQTSGFNLLRTPPKLIALSVLPYLLSSYIFTHIQRNYTQRGGGNNNHVEMREKTKVKEEKKKSDEQLTTTVQSTLKGTRFFHNYNVRKRKKFSYVVTV